MAALTLTGWQVPDLPAWIRPNVTVYDLSGCWLVAPGNGVRIDRDGYARIGIAGVHRLVYTEVVGPIPADRPVIDHVLANGCVWRNCINVNGHLEPVTVRENTMRGDTLAAANAARTACSTCSAPYDGPNLYVYPDGRRDCRVCRAAARERYAGRQARKRQLATVIAQAAAADFGRAA